MPTSAAPVRTARIPGGVAVLAVGALLAGCAAAAPEPTAEPTRDAPAIVRPVAPEGELPAELQARLQAAVDGVMAEYDVPGVAAGVWIPDEGAWTSATGLADIEGDVPVTTEMSWPIRSITKSYTVTLILMLADEGVISLDDTIDQYVDGVTNGDEITLLQLANMSSGNADYTSDAFAEEFEADQTRIFTLDELNAFALGQPEQFAPGTQFLYTNANTNLLGATIEAATGQAYAEVLDERILQPLGQTGTRYSTDVAEWTAPHPTGYVIVDGEAIAMTENSSILGAAGSMYSTLEDGRAWAASLGSGLFLTPQTQELREVGHEIPKPPYDLYAVGMGETDGWFGHNGEGLGFTAANFYDPVTGAVIVVYANESNVFDRAHPADRIFRALAEVLTGAQG